MWLWIPAEMNPKTSRRLLEITMAQYVKIIKKKTKKKQEEELKLIME